MDYSQLIKLPIIDSHIHFVHPEMMDDVLELMDEAGHSQANLVCIPNRDMTTHNPAALQFKERHPEKVFISGALEYAPMMADRAHASDILAGQVLALKSQGFDGLKLIEGKPEVRKLLPVPLDGPEYEGMWAVLEEEQFPVVFHVADPDEFWDAALCPGWARQSGWDYSDGSYPTKEDLYGEVEHILERHPTLKITFAHFYFLSKELERAAGFLDRHPTVCFDLTPHTGMYVDFSQNPVGAREFILRYADRILYGTDTDTRTLKRGPDGYNFMRSIPWLVRAMLEIPGSFELQGVTYNGLGLPEPALEKIYQKNFLRIYTPND